MIRLHNALWPGLVGKVPGTHEPPLSLERMLDLTVAARVDGRGFDGVDLFLGQPHVDIGACEDDIRRLAERIAARGLRVGTLVAPVWPSAGGGRALGDAGERQRFVAAVTGACRFGRILDDHGVRVDRLIRIDSAADAGEFASDPAGHRQRIIATFAEAAAVAADAGQCLAAEGEVCWAGMATWRDMLAILEGVGRPEALGFQADLAHTYFYLVGAAGDPLVADPTDPAEFAAGYARMVAALGPWTVDLHIAQTDGTLHGGGDHAPTGRHCPPEDPRGRLDVVACARRWLLDDRGVPRPAIRHLCWDGCLFPNAVLEDPVTWTAVLALMQAVAPGTLVAEGVHS